MGELNTGIHNAPVTVPEAAPGITGKIKALPIPTHWLRNLLLTVGSLAGWLTSPTAFVSPHGPDGLRLVTSALLSHPPPAWPPWPLLSCLSDELPQKQPSLPTAPTLSPGTLGQWWSHQICCMEAAATFPGNTLTLSSQAGERSGWSLHCPCWQGLFPWYGTLRPHIQPPQTGWTRVSTRCRGLEGAWPQAMFLCPRWPLRSPDHANLQESMREKTQGSRHSLRSWTQNLVETP